MTGEAVGRPRVNDDDAVLAIANRIGRGVSQADDEREDYLRDVLAKGALDDGQPPAFVGGPDQVDDHDGPTADLPEHVSRSEASRPVPTRKKESPPLLSESALYGRLGEMVDAGQGHTEADPAGVLGSLLSGVGVLIGPASHLMIGSTRHPLLIWPLLFGPTGAGRKGEATNTAEQFLDRVDAPSFAILRATGLSSGEGLIERIRDPVEITRGKTVERLGTEDKRLFLVEPEFSSVMARAKRDGSTLPAVLRQAWDGRALSVLNRAALRASGSHVGVVGHITPREFRARLAEAELAGGLYNRFLPVWVDRRGLLSMPEPIEPVVIEALSAGLASAIRKSRTHGSSVLRLAGPALAWWSEEIYPSLSMVDDSDEAWTEFSRRAAPYCLRIAGVYAVTDGRVVISLADLSAAHQLVAFAMATARYVLGRMTRDPRLDRLRRFVDEHPAGVTRTEISGLFGRHMSTAMLDELIAGLLSDGAYEEVQVVTKGRPATVIRSKAKDAK